MINIQENIFGNAKNDIVTGALDLLFVKRLGSGSARTVYELSGGTHVIKLEHADSYQFMRQNIIEHSIWNDFQYTVEGPKWLAECGSISGNGRALMQEKLEIFTDINDERLPKRVPRFLTDMKINNWGIDSNGNVKCVDYGLILLMQGNPWQLRKVNWGYPA